LAKTIRDLIAATQRVFGFTAVMVSHDIPEIFGISDCVAMLGDGTIVAMAPSAEFQRTSDQRIREFITGHSAAATQAQQGRRELRRAA